MRIRITPICEDRTVTRSHIMLNTGRLGMRRGDRGKYMISLHSGDAVA